MLYIYEGGKYLQLCNCHNYTKLMDFKENKQRINRKAKRPHEFTFKI